MDSMRNERSQNCPICLEDYINGELISITKCNHVYHNKCIVEWRKVSDTCPLCMSPLKLKRGKLKNMLRKIKNKWRRFRRFRFRRFFIRHKSIIYFYLAIIICIIIIAL